MTSEERDRIILDGEVLPASQRSVSLAPEVAHLPPGMLGVGLFARARYASEQKQFEAFTRLVHAKNDLLRALNEQQGLIIDYAIDGERARSLDDLRAIARQRVRNELAAVQTEAELNGLRADTEKERLLLERDRLRKARADFNTPTPAPTSGTAHKRSLADDFDDVGKEIERVEQAYESMRAEMIRRAGSEDKLSDDERRRLKQFELLRNKLLNNAMEALF